MVKKKEILTELFDAINCPEKPLKRKRNEMRMKTSFSSLFIEKVVKIATKKKRGNFNCREFPEKKADDHKNWWSLRTALPPSNSPPSSASYLKHKQQNKNVANKVSLINDSGMQKNDMCLQHAMCLTVLQVFYRRRREKCGKTCHEASHL